MGDIEELKRIQRENDASFGIRSIERPIEQKNIPDYINMDKLLKIDKGETIEVRTGLSKNEFERVYNILEAVPETVKRGRKLLDLEVRLVILLQWLRYGQTFVYLGKSFSLKSARIQSCISSIWNNLANALFDTFIPKRPLGYNCERKFTNYKRAVGALDATLIPIAKPSLTTENRSHYSGKHKRHGIKLQVLTAPDGTCIHFGGTINGCRNDITLYRISGLARAMAKQEVDSEGIPIIVRPQILADGGYAGIRDTYPEAVIPFRKPQHGSLTNHQKKINREISQDRVIVERFFGRLKSYWAILQRPYRSEKDSVYDLMRICVSLTNLKIQSSPLFSDEKISDPDAVHSTEEEEEEEEKREEEEETVTESFSTTSTDITPITTSQVEDLVRSSPPKTTVRKRSTPLTPQTPSKKSPVKRKSVRRK